MSDNTEALRRIARELRAYNPAADEHKGAHIHGVWAREIDAALAQQAAPPTAQAEPLSPCEGGPGDCGMECSYPCSKVSPAAQAGDALPPEAWRALDGCKAMCERIIKQYGGWPQCGVDFNALLAGINLALAARAAQAVDAWISVEDRLPEGGAA